MMPAARDANAGWTRLEMLLTDTKAGDAVSIDALAEDTGLSIAVCSRIMCELERIELFSRRTDNIYVRRSLWPNTR
jgi:hypothetical protein